MPGWTRAAAGGATLLLAAFCAPAAALSQTAPPNPLVTRDPGDWWVQSTNGVLRIHLFRGLSAEGYLVEVYDSCPSTPGVVTRETLGPTAELHWFDQTGNTLRSIFVGSHRAVYTPHDCGRTLGACETIATITREATGEETVFEVRAETVFENGVLQYASVVTLDGAVASRITARTEIAEDGFLIRSEIEAQGPSPSRPPRREVIEHVDASALEPHCAPQEPRREGEGGMAPPAPRTQEG